MDSNLTAERQGTSLICAIEKKNFSEIKQILKFFQDKIVEGEQDYANWIVNPENFVKVKDRFMTHLGAPNKLLMLKHRAPSKNRRAFLFSQMFLNAAERLTPNE